MWGRKATQAGQDCKRPNISFKGMRVLASKLRGITEESEKLIIREKVELVMRWRSVLEISPNTESCEYLIVLRLKAYAKG